MIRVGGAIETKSLLRQRATRKKGECCHRFGLIPIVLPLCDLLYGCAPALRVPALLP